LTKDFALTVDDDDRVSGEAALEEVDFAVGGGGDRGREAEFGLDAELGLLEREETADFHIAEVRDGIGVILEGDGEGRVETWINGRLGESCGQDQLVVDPVFDAAGVDDKTKVVPLAGRVGRAGRGSFQSVDGTGLALPAESRVGALLVTKELELQRSVVELDARF